MPLDFPDEHNPEDIFICGMYRHLDYLMNDAAKFATVQEWAKLTGKDKHWSDKAWESYLKFRRAREAQNYKYYYCGILVKDFGPRWLKENFSGSKAAEMTKDADSTLSTWMNICCDPAIHREMRRVPNDC